VEGDRLGLVVGLPDGLVDGDTVGETDGLILGDFGVVTVEAVREWICNQGLFCKHST
jgi:hypothetical protein